MAAPEAGDGSATAAAAPASKTARKAAKKAGRKAARKKVRFEDDEAPAGRKKKRARLEKMRRAGIFGVPGQPARPRKKKKKRRDELVRPSPPLEQTDPLKHYLAGEMVPCPVGCGGFSEVVRISTMENGAGEIWFECLSCAQRRMFEMPPATEEERRGIFDLVEGGAEPVCPRHSKPVQLRRRGRNFVCPECGVAFPDIT